MLARRIPLVLLGVAILAACATSRLPALPPVSAALSDAEIEERLAASQRHARWWYRGWYAASVGGVVVGGLQAGFGKDSGDRAGGITTAVLGAGGVAYLYLMPMNARYGADPLRDLPAAAHAERVRKLERAQEILAENAERATVQVDWVAHAANAAVSLAAGLVVLGVSDDSAAAVATAVPALVGGEIQFWTEPAAPRRDAEDYVRRFSGLPSAVPGGLHLSPTARGGLGLRWDF